MPRLSLTLAGQGALLLIPLLALAALLAYYKTVPRVEGPTRRLLVALRAIGFLLLVAAICEPVAVLSGEERSRPVIALLLDGSESMGIADVPAGEGRRVSRRDAAADLLAARGLLERLRERYVVTPFLFGDAALPAPEMTADLGGGSQTTDIAASLAGSRATGPVDAVLLVSDGVRTAGADPVGAAREFGKPIFAIGVGDPTPPRDLAVDGILASEAVYAGTPSPIVGSLRGRGFRGDPVEVLLEDGGVVVARDTVTLPEGSEVAEVRFTRAFETDGVHRLTLRIPAREGELTVENNARSAAVKVLRKRVEVLALFGRPEFDLGFLRRALGGEEGLRIDAAFLDPQGRIRSVGQPGSAVIQVLNEEKLFAYDLVVLGDPTGPLFKQLPGALLASYLERRQGALLVLAGDRGFEPIPSELWPLLPASPAPSGAALLAARPLRVALTVAGEHHPLTRLDPDLEKNRDLWNALPPLSGVAQLGPARPDADVLAEEATDAGGSRAPVLLLSRRGRVLLVAGRGVWRWEFLTWGAGRSGEAPARLWTNAVRWLISRDEFKRAEVRSEFPSYRRGERVRFVARVLDDSFQPVDGGAVRVRLSRADDPAFSRELALASSGSSGEYRGAISDLPPGSYRLHGEATKAGISLGADEGEFEVWERSAEFESVGMDAEVLDEMARVSGGRYLPVGEATIEALDIDLPEGKREVRREIPLWNHPLLYIGIIGAFVSEWIIRKRRGLP